jgi:type I restriction enzyme S subunit
MSARAVVTSAQAMYSAGSRVDAGYHTSPGVRALRFLHEWQQPPAMDSPPAAGTVNETTTSYTTRKLDTLAEVCVPGGMFIPSRFKRIFVNDLEHGAPYLTGSSIMQSDPLEGAKFLSYRYTRNMDALTLHPGMILVTCSGSIGNTVYVNANFAGAVGSPDLLRIVANPDVIPSGYLYTVLSSEPGRALIEQKTYGAVVPHIEAHHVTDLPIPRLDPATEQRIHEMIERAAALRVAALHSRNHAMEILANSLGIDISRFTVRNAVAVRQTSLNMRLEGNYHTARQTADTIFKASELDLVPVGELLEDIFYLGKLHRVFVNTSENGVPMLSISDVLKSKITSEKYISKTLSRNVEQAKLQEGTVLISRTGTPGLVVYVRREMAGMAGTDHLVRLLPDTTKLLPGYLYIFLSSAVGQGLLAGTLHGSIQLQLPPEYITRLEIPLPSVQIQNSIQSLVEHYSEALTQASEHEDAAQALLLAALGWETE